MLLYYKICPCSLCQFLRNVLSVVAIEIKALQLELQNSKTELSESEESKQKLSEALTESQKREKELDEILHDMQSENLSLTRNYGEAKKELGEVTKKLRGFEEDFANKADSSEMSKQIMNQMKNELEILRAENEERRNEEETQRKIINDMKVVSTLFYFCEIFLYIPSLCTMLAFCCVAC